MDSKVVMRVRMHALRNGISQSERAAKSKQICTRVLGLTQWQQSRVVCIYRALAQEVDTRILLSQKKSFVIIEPTSPLPFPQALGANVFIVPGVAFDRRGYRLGWGRGYYDRLLADMKVPKIGLAYAFQIVSRLATDRYDIPMDIIVTEDEAITP